MKNLFLFFTAFMLSFSTYSFAADECPVGQMIDPETGNCVEVPTIDAPDESTSE